MFKICITIFIILFFIFILSICSAASKEDEFYNRINKNLDSKEK